MRNCIKRPSIRKVENHTFSGKDGERSQTDKADLRESFSSLKPAWCSGCPGTQEAEAGRSAELWDFSPSTVGSVGLQRRYFTQEPLLTVFVLGARDETLKTGTTIIRASPGMAPTRY